MFFQGGIGFLLTCMNFWLFVVEASPVCFEICLQRCLLIGAKLKCILSLLTWVISMSSYFHEEKA